MEYLSTGARVLLGGVFIVSVVSKVRTRADRTAFADSLVAMRLVVSAASARILARTVIAIEVVLVALLLTSATAPYGLFGLATVCGVYGVALAREARRPDPVACRCFGTDARPVSTVHIVRNGALAGIALVGSFSGGTIGEVAHILPAVVGAIGAAVTVRLDDLVALFSSPAR